MYERIKELRLEKGWTQKEVAEQIGCDTSTYGKYERGKIKLSVPVLLKLSQLYKVNCQNLLGLPDIKKLR